MDTKSTNSKAYIFTKVIAVLMVIITLGYSGMQIAKSYVQYERQSTSYFRLWDTVSNYGDRNAVFSSYIFEDDMAGYVADLAELMYYYGDGSKQAYKAAVKDEDYEELKKKLLYNLFYKCNSGSEESVLALLSLSDENVISMKLIKENKDYYDEYEENYLDFINGYTAMEIVRDYTSNTFYGTSWTYSQELKEALKSDADILIDIEHWSFLYEDGEYVDEGIRAGQYAVKVNDAKLKYFLMEIDKITYLTYEQFLDDYKQKMTSFENRYKNIHYIYKDKDGKVFSNVKNDKEVSYDDYDYILWGPSYYLTDFYGSAYTIENYDIDDVWVDRSNIGAVTPTRAVYVETTVPTQVSTTLLNDKSDKVEVTEPTTMRDKLETTTTMYSSSKNKIRIADLENNSFCIFFDKNATFNGLSVHEMEDELSIANTYVFNLFLYSGIALIGFVLATLILVALCGRKRKGDTEVTFPFSDRMFFEFKTILNIGLSYGALLAGVTFTDTLYQKGLDRFAYSVSAVAMVAIGLLLMDYILYIVRHLKANKFVKSLFVVWFVKVLCVKGIKVLKKIWAAAGKVFGIVILPVRKLKEALNSEKLFYAKNVEQTVKIKTAILLAINVPIVLLCFLYMCVFDGVDGWGDVVIIALLAIPTLACDVLALIRGLSFVGGVSRIAEVIGEYRKGNLDTPINRAGLPSYLVPVGENLEGLGEGIKLAVDEAVKQEATKTELITNISHDLKTPLTSIINYVDLLKKCDIEDETAKSYLEVLGEKSDRLKILITDLVEASKAATGNVEVNLVKISLREILTQLVGEFSDAFEKRKLDVILSVPVSDITVLADNKLLYRVLENLAVNIEKYSMEGTRVYISAESNGTKGVIIFKNISKAPLNITPDELKQRFVRGDASRTTDGNGLGLSIAENLCIVQGGSLDIDIVGDLFIAKVELNCR